MSRFLIGNLFLAASILLASFAQVVIKALMSELDENASFSVKLEQMLAGGRLWRAVLAGTMVVSGFLCWVVCLSRLDLSYAYPIACGSALIVAILSVVFLGETVTWRMWAGTLLILGGTLFLTPAK